ncbi:unnamed protein product [Aphanomyces euteiches]|nr:hypothetical protein AeRB84_004066 [Aphanomyces euteiches]
MLLGGQFVSLSAGLAAGTVSFGLAIILMGLAYLCFAWSLAEVTSAVPFAGGSYGLARCTLGFYAGFLVGCCDILEYIIFTSLGCVLLGQMLVSKWEWLDPYQPLIWLVNLVIPLAIAIRGGHLYWRVNFGSAILLLVVVFFYFFSAMTAASLTEYSGGAEFACVGGFASFFTALPQAASLFSGVEGLTTFSKMVSQPQRHIPKGQLASMGTLFFTAVSMYLLALSLPPGAQKLYLEASVLNGGFALSFNISEASAVLFSAPSMIACVPTAAMVASNILAAMATSKLFPPRLGKIHRRFHTPDQAILFVGVLSYALCFPVLYARQVVALLFNLSLVFAFTTYLAQCVGYVYLNLHLTRLDRLQTSPVGIPGVIFAAFVFGASLVSILFCQNDDFVALAVSTILFIILSMYYHFVAKFRQQVSRDEQRLLFFANISKQRQSEHRWRYRHRQMVNWGHFWHGSVSTTMHTILPFTSPRSTRNIRVVVVQKKK